MPFVITPIKNKSDRQKKDDIEFSPRAESGKQSPASSVQHSLRSQNSNPYENIALLLLPQSESHTLPMTPLIRRLPELTIPIRDSQPSNSNPRRNKTSATDKGKIAHLATKLKKRV